MANCNKLPLVVNQQPKAVVAFVATATGSNSANVSSLATSVTQTMASASIMGVWWSGTWSISRPAPNGLANTIMSLSGAGTMDFARDGGFTLNTNPAGTITATATGAGTLILALRKEFTDSSLA